MPPGSCPGAASTVHHTKVVTIGGMQGLISALFVAVLLLAVVHFLLPREPLVRQAQGRLSLRPPLPRLLGEAAIPLLGLFAATYFLALLLYARVLPGVAFVGFAVWWLGRRVWRQWHSSSIVFDRSTDC